MAETETKSMTRMRQRPIVRLGILLISHSLLVSVICCTAGVLALLLLPVLAKNTYISENALMPGSASSMLSHQEVLEANKLVRDISSLSSKPSGAAIESQGIIVQYMSNLGAEVNYHKFHPRLNQFGPLHFFSGPGSEVTQDNFTCSLYGVNIVGIIRAPRGDGKEAIVLVTPYDSVRGGVGEALSLGIAYSVFSLLARVTWLAKDIIWLVADSQYGEYAPVTAWLRDYHNPVFGDLGSLNTEMCDDNKNIYKLKENSNPERKIPYTFRRAGTMAAALVLKVAYRNEQIEDTLSIYAEASNGQMPNLDLINIVNYLAVHKQGLRVKVEKFWSLLESKWLRILGDVFESLGKLAKSLNADWKFGISASDYVEGTATLASSLYYQALGVPTGPHGAFRDYQVDAITLEISPKFSFNNKDRRSDFILQGGRLIEGVIRSVNNLLEKFHQSFFLYLLTSPGKFVSVGVYMIAFALIVAPLPVVAASLYADSNGWIASKKDKKSTNSDELGPSLKSWKWLNSAKRVFVVHLWGAIVSLLPYFITQICDCSPKSNFLIWISLSMLILLILRQILGSSYSHVSELQPQESEWALLKSVTISSLFIGLGLMSVINFATAEIGALLLVPASLMAHPLKLDLKSRSLRSFLRLICNLVLGVISFPPATFFLLKGVFEGFDGTNAGDFWNWVESLWAWNSATYLYIGIRSDDSGVGWLWRSCRRLKKLQLKSCSGIGDGGSFSSFVKCLDGLEEIEVRTCRSIVDVVLLKLAENCDSLNSLLLYDGGSRDGLLQFINHSRCNLQKLDLRLPLDLTNNHLSAVAVNFRSLSTLRLQSCCLVTGDGLRTLGIAMSSGLEELALINCDVVEREPGLLATLGQNLRRLRKLDLSYNEMLHDKELTAMLVSCSFLVELKLSGCRRLSGVAMVSMSKSCKRLETLDIVNCCGIDADAVELFVISSPQLKRLEVEENKISDAAKSCASHKFVEAAI